jgi:hypothetical protein
MGIRFSLKSPESGSMTRHWPFEVYHQVLVDAVSEQFQSMRYLDRNSREGSGSSIISLLCFGGGSLVE